MIHFEDLTGGDSESSYLPTAEEWFAIGEPALKLLPAYLSVREIAHTEYGFRLLTDYFSVLCSHKYRRLARVITSYLVNVERDAAIPTPAVLIKGRNKKGYIDWSFGQVPIDKHPSSRIIVTRKNAYGKIYGCKFVASKGFKKTAPESSPLTQSPLDPLLAIMEEANAILSAAEGLAEDYEGEVIDLPPDLKG